MGLLDTSPQLDAAASAGAAPINGLLSGVTAGLNAGHIINHENLLKQELAQKQKDQDTKDNIAQLQKTTDLLKEKWVPNDTKVKMFNSGVLPTLTKMGLNVPPMTAWQDQFTDAAKGLHDIVTKGQEKGMHPADIEVLAAQHLMQYEKDVQDSGKPVLTALQHAQEGETSRTKTVDKADSGYQLRQDRLEKNYSDSFNKILSNRSGGLGLQDAKVNQAIDLQKMLEGTYDQKTGSYNVPPSLYTELALGLARLLSPTGQVGVQLENELRQKTAREGLAGAMIYLGADPKKIGGSTQNVIKMFADSIHRQGTTAETLRDKYISQLKGRRPSGLDAERADHVESSGVGNSYNEHYQNSPLNQPAAQPKMVTQNGHTYTLNPATGQYE